MLPPVCSSRAGGVDTRCAPEEPAYTVEFPDISEIITSGDTLSDAFAKACEALDLRLERLQKLGTAVPPCKHRLVVEAA
jgi:predicted RNase H-like HicB family nuclease